MTEIFIDHDLMRTIIRAMIKAIEVDVPNYRQMLDLTSDNYIRVIRGDAISTNLENMVASESVMVHRFDRNSFHCRMVIDRKNKITYTITTEQNLCNIPKKKDRKRPHFLQSILAMENGDVQGEYIQQVLFPMGQFEEEELKNDYDKIVEGIIESEEYHHYVISYTYSGNELVDVNLNYLDKGFNFVSKASLNEYIKPDFAKLTDPIPEAEEATEKSAKSARSLVSLKKGIQPVAIDVQLKKMENEHQGLK